MRTKDALYQRRSVRAYTDEPVSECTIGLLLDAAVQAPSAVNSQPWAFVVVQDRKVLKRLSDRALRLVKGKPIASSFRRFFDDPEFSIFYDASTLVIICAKPIGEHPDWDCCLAGENLLIAARDMGLGACVVGFAWPALALPEVKRELGIPVDYTAVLPIIIGSPREFPPPTGRDAPEILTWLNPVRSEPVML